MIFIIFAFLCGKVVDAGIVQTQGSKGPSSSDSSYLTMLDANARAISIVSSGDPLTLGPTKTNTTSPYYFVGMADGMGAWLSPTDPHKFIVILNHELSYSNGKAIVL